MRIGKVRGFIAGVLRLLSGDYQEQRAWWRTAAAPDGQPIPATILLVQEVLEAQLERASAATRNVETKAALVIPAIGVMVGIVGSDVSSRVQSNGLLLGLGLLLVLAAIATIVLAILSLAPACTQTGHRPSALPKGSWRRLTTHASTT